MGTGFEGSGIFIKLEFRNMKIRVVIPNPDLIADSTPFIHVFAKLPILALGIIYRVQRTTFCAGKLNPDVMPRPGGTWAVCGYEHKQVFRHWSPDALPPRALQRR